MAELVTACGQGLPVEKLAASFQVNRTTVLGHVRRQGVPRRDRRALRGGDVDRAVELYAEGRSAELVAEELEVAASTVRRALKEGRCRPALGGTSTAIPLTARLDVERFLQDGAERRLGVDVVDDRDARSAQIILFWRPAGVRSRSRQHASWYARKRIVYRDSPRHAQRTRAPIAA